MRILITGSRTGIGQHLARHCLEHGHEVWGVARGSQAELARSWAGGALKFRHAQGDVADWAHMAALREVVGQAWDHLDALVCCAGSQPPIGPSMALDPSAWGRNLRVNLDGTFHAIRAFHDRLLRAPRRAKILCFSGGGATGPRPNFSAYACAKAGVVRLVETLAAEWVGEPVDINAVAPGAIATAMTDEVVAVGPGRAGEHEYAQAVANRSGSPAALDKVSGLVDFLLSAESDGITGRLLSAPWDPWPTLAAHREQLASSDIYCLRRIVPKDRGLSW